MRNTTGVRGVEAIEEAAILLSRLTVSAKRPAYVEGKHLAISIDPRWSVETETVSLSVTCYTKAVQPVDWQGLRLNIERREGEHSITWLTFLNARGQARRDGLPSEGEYSLSLPARVKAQIVRRILASPQRRIRKRGAIRWSYEDDESSTALEREPTEELLQEGIVPNGAISWRITETADGFLQVYLENEIEINPQKLAVNIVESKTGHVQYSGVVELVPGTIAGRLAGRFMLGRSEDVRRPCDLIFEPLSPAESGTE